MSGRPPKDINQGTIWGRIADTTKQKSENGKPYLFITLECGNELLGNVQTYVRLWGEERVEKFLDYYKQHPHDSYRFFCFFNQYKDREGRVLSNYTAYKWVPYSGDELKAAFVLRGTVTKVEESAEGTAVSLFLKREGGEGYEPAEEKFLVHLHPRCTFKGLAKAELKDGSYVEVAGFLRAKEPEDAFGRQSTDIRPYVMEVHIYEPF